MKFDTILATAHSITNRFGPTVLYLPEDNVNSEIFLGSELIETIYPHRTYFFNKSHVISFLNSYKTPIIRT